MSETVVFVGSYANADESGVEVFRFDEASGELSKVSEYVGLTNPTFLNIDSKKKLIYTCSEMKNDDGSKSGEVSVLSYDRSYELMLLQQKKSTEKTTCHIQRDQSSQFLTVTSYHGGSVGLLELDEDGLVKQLVDEAVHEGKKDKPEPENQPRAHSSFYSHDGKYLLVQDLGFSQIVTYQVDSAQKRLIKVATYQLPEGTGPRHLTFHPTRDLAYAINELNSTVYVFSFNNEDGTLSELQTISTLPTGYSGSNGTAEIAISNDGRFVYGSNRGHDSIVVYALLEDGTLELKQHMSTKGGHPRHFTLMPSGQFLLVANRDGNNIVTFKVNTSTGLLEETSFEAYSTKPVCLIPIKTN